MIAGCLVPHDHRSGPEEAFMRWQRLVLVVIVAVLLAELGLIVALAVGWNDPRPPGVPRWEATDVPFGLIAPPDADAVVLFEPLVGDFTLEVRARPVSGPDFNGYGVLYRAHDEAHGYVFAIGADGYWAVLRMEGGDTVELVEWRQFPHVRRGRQPNRLRVCCEGPRCDFYIDDEYAGGLSDPTWLEGKVGVWVRSFGYEPVQVEFLSVRLWTE